MKSLKPRLFTAVVGISLLLLVLYIAELWNPIVGILIGAVTAFMTGEYLNANHLLKRYSLAIPCLLFALLMPMLISTAYIYLLVVCFIIAVFTVMIVNHEHINFGHVAYATAGTSLISLGMSALSSICSSGVGITFYFITIFALPWMADAGGFFVGATLGKHKLCPNISPKKTVEGAIGGIVFCVLSAIAIWFIFNNWVMPDAKLSFTALLILGIIDAPLSIIGDLSFSLIKRNCNIKDYSSIFPGHGGMLDRFDSIIFTAPAIIVLNQFIPFITVV